MENHDALTCVTSAQAKVLLPTVLGGRFDHDSANMAFFFESRFGKYRFAPALLLRSERSVSLVFVRHPPPSHPFHSFSFDKMTLSTSTSFSSDFETEALDLGVFDRGNKWTTQVYP